MPVCWAHALPPTRTDPAFTPEPSAGTSMRDCVFTGPFADQPRWVQNASNLSKLVTSRSTSHLVADT